MEHINEIEERHYKFFEDLGLIREHVDDYFKDMGDFHQKEFLEHTDVMIKKEKEIQERFLKLKNNV